MRASSSIKKTLALGLILFLMFVPVVPVSAGVTIKNAITSVQGENYAITANIEYRLSKKAIEALTNGVPLTWTYRFKIEEQRDYFWNKTVADKSILYRIQYHALLNMYRVKNESTGVADNFSTLQAALDLLSTLQDYPLIEKAEISGQKTYIVKMKITFERDALPLPLRPKSYVSSQWQLSSDWLIWTLKK